MQLLHELFDLESWNVFFGLIDRFSTSYHKTKETSSFELVSLCGTPSDYRTFYRAMLSVYEFAKWVEVYD